MSPQNETGLAVAAPLRAMAQRLGIDEEQVYNTLCQTLSQEATEAELVAFCIVANEHGLNPFKKELYCIPKKGGGLIPYVPIDGWANIVNRHQDFDGCEFEEHEDENGKVVAVTCTMHVKGRDHPIVLKERLEECTRPGDNWKNMPCRMLRHKAFMQAARIAFSLGGIFDKDEAEDIVRNDTTLTPPRKIVVELQEDLTPRPSINPPTITAPIIKPVPITELTDEETHPEGDLISESQRRRLFAIANKAGNKTAALKNYLHDKYFITSSKNITSDVYEEICEWAAKPPSPTTSLH